MLLATCQPGLEPIVMDDLKRLGVIPMARVHPGVLRVDRLVDHEDLAVCCKARTVDDLYVQIWSGDPDAFRRRLSGSTLVIPGEILAAHRMVLADSGRRPQGRIKTTCMLYGAFDLRRQDIEARLARQLRTAYPSWRIDLEHPDAEFVSFVFRRSAVIALRITDPTFRHRNYRRVPAALSPTVAAAMVRLAQPAADDCLLDPCCGGGTILLERAQMGPYRELLGGDCSADAVDVARLNFGKRHQPWSLQVWDARRLPLPDGRVNRVISNLPFGVQLPAMGGVAAFAHACLVEAARVLKPGGRAVFLWPQGTPVIVPSQLREAERVPFALAGQSVVACGFVRRSEREPGCDRDNVAGSL